METFTEPKELTINPHFKEQARKNLSGLTDDMIDVPIVQIIRDFNKLPYCFTMQCCHGHFLYNGQRDPNNFDPLPGTETVGRVDYRIAYIAFCVENSEPGKRFISVLKGIRAFDPENIQFGSAEWFWKRQINSYALQVEPDRFKNKDRVILDLKEALHIEKTRNRFFIQLNELIRNE